MSAERGLRLDVRAFLGLARAALRRGARREWALYFLIAPLVVAAATMVASVDLAPQVALARKTLAEQTAARERAAATAQAPERAAKPPAPSQPKPGRSASVGETVYLGWSETSSVIWQASDNGISTRWTNGPSAEGAAGSFAKGLAEAAGLLAEGPSWRPEVVGLVGELPEESARRLLRFPSKQVPVRIADVDEFLAAQARAGRRAAALSMQRGEVWLARDPSLSRSEQRARWAWARGAAVALVQERTDALLSRAGAGSDTARKATSATVGEIDLDASGSEPARGRQPNETLSELGAARSQEVLGVFLLWTLLHFGLLMGAGQGMDWTRRASEGSFEPFAPSPRSSWALACADPAANATLGAMGAAVGVALACAANAALGVAAPSWNLSTPLAAAAAGVAMLWIAFLAVGLYECFAMTVSTRWYVRIPLGLAGPVLVDVFFLVGQLPLSALLSFGSLNDWETMDMARGLAGAAYSAPAMAAVALFWGWALHRRIGRFQRAPWQAKPVK